MKFKIFITTLLLLSLGAVTSTFGAITPTRFDSVQIRKGLKTNYGIDIGTYLNVAGATTLTGNLTNTGVIRMTSGFGLNLPSLADPTAVFGDYLNLASRLDTVGSPTTGVVGWEYRADSIEYKPVLADSNGLILKALGIRADNDSGYIRIAAEPILLDTIGGKESGFFIEVSLPDTTQYEFYAGLAEKTFSADNKILNGVYFRILDETNKMIFTTARGGTMDSVTAVANTAAASFYKLAFVANGSGSVTGYVNGVALTAISKYIPRTANLTPFIMVKRGSAVSARVYVYIKSIGFYQYR